jgi:hypothetical protein
MEAAIKATIKMLNIIEDQFQESAKEHKIEKEQ